MKEVLWPLAVATLEASKGPARFRSTKIVVDDGVPTQFFTTCTVERSCLLVMVQLMTPPSTAGEVTGKGPPL